MFIILKKNWVGWVEKVNNLMIIINFYSYWHRIILSHEVPRQLITTQEFLKKKSPPHSNDFWLDKILFHGILTTNSSCKPLRLLPRLNWPEKTTSPAACQTNNYCSKKRETKKMNAEKWCRNRFLMQTKLLFISL